MAPCTPLLLPARDEVFTSFDHKKSSVLQSLQQQLREHVYLFAFEPPQGKISEQNEVILLPAARIAVILGEQSLVQSGVGRPPELRTHEKRAGKGAKRQHCGETDPSPSAYKLAPARPFATRVAKIIVRGSGTWTSSGGEKLKNQVVTLGDKTVVLL